MKIGLVSPYSFDRPGGVQNHVLGLAAWLRTRGHDVRVAGPGHHSEITSLGRALPIRFNGSVARICVDPRVPFRLRAWADGLELVHVHEPFVPLVGLAATRLPVPVVATFHAATGRRLHRVLRPLAGWLRTAHTIAVSEVAAAAPRALGLAPALIGNGIDVAGLTHAGVRDASLITFVGRYDEPRKGFSYLVEALHEVRLARPDAGLLVIGAGAKRLPGIEFAGPLSDAERNAHLSRTSVFVAPHIGGESFGMVLIEALAAGADVVASDLPSFREVLTDEHGPAARLVPPADPGALASAIGQALDAGPICSEQRRRDLASTFDWSRIGPRVEAVYKAALGIA